MSDYNFNLFVDHSQRVLRVLRPQCTYHTALTGSGLSESDIQRAVKVLAERGIQVTYYNFRPERSVTFQIK